ncbi:hypothetical protein OJF2_19670 [Aquisphaera giovannonii]|uniref:Uncharacterized protein n=1 Tax=Aquisphaera giovannonii TaxID=406548 RepID=A0A5B9W0J5_9BACT|nr:hypothetical protein [Aquisphaera giovannonii]QEH33465.1 hypothetical protein OJF2_19670 [Aquisphaera giovannonii]
MRADDRPGGRPRRREDLEGRLKALDAGPVPDGLLDRCLETLDGPGSPETLELPGRRRTAWVSPLAAAAAILVLIGGVAMLSRPGAAAAAEFLQAARAGWSEVPACHRVMTMGGPDHPRIVETWFARGKGGRQEIRVGGELTGVAVSNGRWEYRWDIPGKLVAVWSGSLVNQRGAFSSAGLIEDSESLVRWAEDHRADIRVEADTLGGRKLRKVTLRWPGPEGQPGGQSDTVWFDHESLRPVRQVSHTFDGRAIEVTLDYPAPESLPADLFSFSMPRDVTLEVNDPDLGRQLYSDPLSPVPGPATPAGRERK